jgi:hypothetical protein
MILNGIQTFRSHALGSQEDILPFKKKLYSWSLLSHFLHGEQELFFLLPPLLPPTLLCYTKINTCQNLKKENCILSKYIQG